MVYLNAFIDFGNKLTSIGFSLLPLSFFAYLVFRPLVYWMRKGYMKLVKSVWYLAAGATTLAGDNRVETVVMFITFIEAYDLVFQYFEDKRNEKDSAS